MRCDGFDLDQQLVGEEARDFEQRDRRTDRRRDGRQEAVARLAVGRQIGHVAQQYRELDEIAGVAPRRRQRGLKVLEDLLGLGRKVARTDKGAIAIETLKAGEPLPLNHLASS